MTVRVEPSFAFRHSSGKSVWDLTLFLTHPHRGGPKVHGVARISGEFARQFSQPILREQVYNPYCRINKEERHKHAEFNNEWSRHNHSTTDSFRFLTVEGVCPIVRSSFLTSGALVIIKSAYWSLARNPKGISSSLLFFFGHDTLLWIGGVPKTRAALA